ncbi:phage BR0599 family protein [Lysobacter sp. CA199]|uniref:phage BR0599 family protein n=1 Tax=Lysobacter sp. CA199 TaxID=3455608 RepID=UPI003F8D0471
MTFNARETSYSDGVPIRLLDFVRGSVHWRYTTADRPIVHNGVTFLPVGGPVQASALQESLEIKKATRTVKLPRSLPVVENWWPFSPTEDVGLVIFAKHYEDADAEVEWIGRVMAVPFENDETVVMSCEPSRTAAVRRGKNRCWGIGCPLALYSAGRGQCNVSRDAHAINTVIASVSGVQVQAPGFLSVPSGRLAGGYIEYDGPFGTKQRRDIDSHDGGTIWLDYPLVGLPQGSAITAFPGCAGTWADCEYFDNEDNYGGQLHMPRRNPFDGLPVW